MIDAQRVDFISVPTRDRERSAKFYGEVLGLRRNPNSSEQWIEFEAGNVTLALLPHEYMGGGEFTPNSGPVALRVPDVEDARRKLEAAGVEFRMETLDSGVCHMAAFVDPDGNSLMIHSRYAPYADGSTP